MDIDEPLYVRNPKTGTIKGPFSRSDIERAVAAGELGRQVEVKADTDADWVRLGEHSAFRVGVGAPERAPTEQRRAPAERMRARVDPNNPYATLEQDDDSPRRVAPSWLELLFSFQGRFPRRLYWGTRVLALLPLVAVGVIAAATQRANAGGSGVMLLIVPAYIISVWIMLASSVKRWHDRDKSGWWILVAMIPLIGGFWELAEAGCMRGTHGPNRYGEDPT